MNWKYLLLGGIAVLIVLSLYSAYKKRSVGASAAQGFQNPTETTFTMYYADWCPHCQSAKPDFKEMIEKNGGVVEVKGKRCKIQMISPEEQPEAVKGKDIKGFPTFLLETTDGQTFEYKGSRSTDGYLAFINEKLGGGI